MGPKVWTDGLEVVVARRLDEVPFVLDRHYRVTGHSLRHRCWVEVAPSATLRLHCTVLGSHTATASALAEGRSRWVGRSL